MLGFDKNDLRFIGPCPICKSDFVLQDIRNLKNKGQTSLLHVDCEKCESSLFVTLIKGSAGVITNVGVLTDLSKDDFLRFKSLPVITIDEVLNFYKNYDNKNDSFRTEK